ncbi:MAG: SusC/RagA family TonB-linked outer membrane protein, partial [Chitinophagales bacterium]
TILKDAGSAAIYGARSAWGVMLLTTKKGNRNQQPHFEYGNSLVFNTPNDLPKKASPTQVIQAYGDAGFSSFWTGQDIPTWANLLTAYAKNPRSYPGGHYYDSANSIDYPLQQTDVYKDMTQPFGFQQNHNFSVSGGSAKTNYRLSAGFTDEDGILVTDKDSYKRYNLSSVINSEVKSWLTTQLSVLYSNSATQFPYSNIGETGIFTLAATEPSYTQLGSSGAGAVSYPNYTPRNAILQAFPATNNLENTRLSGKAIATPFKGLTVTGEYTFDKINSNYTQYDRPWYFSNGDGTTTISSPHSDYLKNNSFTNYHALNLYAEYDKSIGDHSFSVLGGFNQEDANYAGLQSERLDAINVNLPSIGLGTGTLTSLDSSSAYSLRGAFYRATYAYKGKYLLEATGRYDGSSKFPDNHRWGFFPSFSAAWRLSEEKFMQSIKPVLSDLKIRASYGAVGNQSINPYEFNPSLSAIYSNWIDNTGLLLTLSSPAAVSSTFTWEKVTTQNIGIDFGLFQNHFTGSFDIYQRATKGMLAPGAQLPAVFGTDAPLQNVADLKSNGWELETHWRDRIGKVSYYAGFSLYDSRATITRYNNTTGLLSGYYKGQKIGEIWGYETDRLYTTNDFVAGSLDASYSNGTLKPGIAPYQGESPNPGDVKFKDRNGDGIVNPGDATVTNPGDQKVIGNNTPRYQYGITGGAAYGGFDFSFFIQGIGKRDLWLANDLTFPFFHAPFTTFYQSELDFWRPENPDADSHYGRVYTLGASNMRFNELPQTRYLYNAAYWRIKNVTLGYSLPQSLLGKAKIERIRLYVSAENLFTHKHLPPGVDPNFLSKGVPDRTDLSDYGGQYPLMKKFSFGLNISF